MKKTLSILVIAILTLILSMGVVNAAQDFKVALNASANRIAQGETVVITVTLKDFKAGETGLSSFLGVLDYDKTVFETVKSTDFSMKNGWSGLTYNESEGNFAITNSSFMTENHEAFQVTLKAKTNATIGNTVVTFKDLNGSNGETDIYPVDQKVTLTIRAASGTTVDTPTATTPTPDSTTVQTPTATTNTNNTSMPNTGVEDYILPAIAVVAVIAVFAYVRYNRIDK